MLKMLGLDPSALVNATEMPDQLPAWPGSLKVYHVWPVKLLADTNTVPVKPAYAFTFTPKLAKS